MKIFSISLISSLKHWFRKPLQFLFLLIGLSLATALWSSIQLLNSQAKNSYDNAVKILTTSETEIIVSKENVLIPIEAFAKLRRAGWLITPILEGYLPSDSSIVVMGIEPITMQEGNNIINTLLDDRQTFEELVIRKNLGFASMETERILRTLPLGLNIEVNDIISPRVLVTDIGVAEKILGQRGKISRFELLANAPYDQEILKELNLKLISSNTQGDLKQLTRSFHLNLSAFGFLGFIVGLFIVYSTFNLAFEQRKATYKNLRSIGVPLRTIYISTLTEIGALALTGGSIGVFLGHWLASILLPDVASTLNNIYGANLNGQLVLSIKQILLALLMPLIGSLLISLKYMIKIHQMAPQNLDFLVIWNKFSNNNTLKLAASGMITGLILILATSSPGLFQSFLIIGLTIVTASILLPLALRITLLFLVSKTDTKMPLVHWFLSDSSHQANRIALSLNALMLAVAVTIGVDNMVKSFKETFNIWLEKRLITELYVRATDQNIASRLLDNLANENHVKNIYPITNLKTRFNRKPIQIVGFDPAEIYAKNWPLVESIEGTWKALESEEGVLINEQFFYSHALGIGDWIELKSILSPGKKVSHIIVGVYPDYGNRFGQIMMNIDSFQKNYSDEIPQNFAVEIADNSFETVSKNLVEKYGLSKSEIINHSTIKELSTKIFDQTFSITNALSRAMIIIAILTMFTTLITLSEIRVTNLAPLWVLGITRLTLLKFELTQFMMLTIFTLSFAIPTGLLICHFLTSYLNVAAFGWKLPFQYYPKIWIETFFVASLASTPAIIFPSVLLFKNSPSLMIARYKNDA